MATKYKNYAQADMKNQLPGHADNAYITPISWIDVFPGVVGEVDMGSKYTIDTDIVYVTNKGSISCFTAPKSVQSDGDMVGEELAKRFQWKPKIILVGDDAVLLELVQNIINERFLLHVKVGECADNTFIQFGTKCTPCKVIAGSFRSGTLADGRKQYEFEMEAYDKFFYNGIITEIDGTVDL